MASDRALDLVVLALSTSPEALKGLVKERAAMVAKINRLEKRVVLLEAVVKWVKEHEAASEELTFAETVGDPNGQPFRRKKTAHIELVRALSQLSSLPGDSHNG